MADFTFEIHSFSPEPPLFNILKTKMEGWRVKRRKKSTSSQRRWSIEIRGRNDTEKDAIVAHWNGQSGTLLPFNWTVNPTGFANATYYVTYEDFKYQNPEGLYHIWDFSIIFLEEIV